MTAAAMVYRWSPRVQADGQKDSLQSVGPVADSFMISMHLFCVPGNQSNDKEPAQGDKTKIYLYKHHQGCAFARVGLFLLLLAIHGRAQTVDPEFKAKCVNRYKNFQDDNAECSYLWNGYNDRFESKQSENKQSVPSLSFLCEERKIGPRCIETTTVARTISKPFSILYFPNAMRWKPWKPTMGGAGGGMGWYSSDGHLFPCKGYDDYCNDYGVRDVEIFGVVPAGETRPAIDGGHTGVLTGILYLRWRETKRSWYCPILQYEMVM